MTHLHLKQPWKPFPAKVRDTRCSEVQNLVHMACQCLCAQPEHPVTTETHLILGAIVRPADPSGALVPDVHGNTSAMLTDSTRYLSGENHNASLSIPEPGSDTFATAALPYAYALDVKGHVYAMSSVEPKTP